MTIKIFKPSKTAMQSGRGKTKQWLAEYVSDVSTTKDTLMGWTSSSDTKSQMLEMFREQSQQQKTYLSYVTYLVYYIEPTYNIHQQI